MAESAIYRALFEELDEAIAILDPETGRYEHANSNYAEVAVTEADRIESVAFVDHAVDRFGLDRETATASLETARDGDSRVVELDLPSGDGGTRPAELELTPLESAAVDAVRATLRLRSSGSPAEKSSDEATQRLEVALAGTSTGVWEWDMETDEVIWTESMERLFGLEPGTFEGTFDAFAERLHPDDRSDVQAAIERAIERDEIFQIEYRIRRDDDEERWVYARGEIREDRSGGRRIVGIVTDVSEQKAKEEALSRKRQQYRELVDRLPEAYYTFDDDWTMTYCNEVLAERFDTTPDEIVGATVWERFPGVEGTALEETFRTVMETGEPASCEHYAETHDFWADVQVYPYEDGIAVISTDISERKEILSMVLDSMPLIFYQTDVEGVLVESRGKGLAKLGVGPGDLVGESVYDLYADEPSIVDAFDRALDGEEVAFTVELGSDHFQTELKPIVEDGAVTSIIGVAMDVTELERQREQLEFFNSILRHDVLNGMTVIGARGEILADELGGELGRHAQTIVDWCRTTTEVTKRVQRVIETLTTPEERLDLDEIDTSAILDRKLSELDTAHPEITFESDVASGLTVQADELLSEVLGNILLNAIEHNDTDDLAIGVTARAGADRVRVEVEDDGRGVEDGRKESIFRRGETSHAKETGSGFGLFFVDVMVEKYGGDIWVEDADGGGARFVLELPRATAEVGR